MTGISLAKDLHRLMRRVGRLTDGQASIDNVNWEDGELNSFGVTIRPNASFYKGGRFKFTVCIPDDFKDGNGIPKVWCDTKIHHPNIDTRMNKDPGTRTGTNICLDLFCSDVWNSIHGLEGVVLGILFLMHNPNLDDALVGGFPCGDADGVKRFAEEVKDYMATGKANDITYDIDFTVINGEFKDLVETKVESDTAGTDSVSDTKRETTELIYDGTHTEEVIRPVRFTRTDIDGDYDENNDSSDGSYYIAFEEDDNCQHVDEFVDDANANRDVVASENDYSIQDVSDIRETVQGKDITILVGADNKTCTTTSVDAATRDVVEDGDPAEGGVKDIHCTNSNRDTVGNEDGGSTNIGYSSVGISADNVHGDDNYEHTAESTDSKDDCLIYTYNDTVETEGIEGSGNSSDKVCTRELKPILSESLNADYTDTMCTEKSLQTANGTTTQIPRNSQIKKRQCMIFGTVFNFISLVFKKMRNR